MTEILAAGGSAIQLTHAVMRTVAHREARATFGEVSRRFSLTDALEAEHAATAAALAEAGLQVSMIDDASGSPEALFVEDFSVSVSARRVIVGAPPSLTRAGEERLLGSRLAGLRSVVEVPPEAAFDGGDVLVFGSHLVAARSKRSNDKGLEFLHRIASLEHLEFSVLELHGDLRLRQLVTPLDAERALHVAGRVHKDAFRSLELIPAPEAQGAGLVIVGNTAIAPAEAPRTIELLDRLGFRVLAIPFESFLAAGVSPSRLSLRC